jgi:acyl dehydratase
MYFEDFEEGSAFETGSRTVTRDMIKQFAELTGDDNPLHTDREFMMNSPHGDVIAHGLLIESIAIGLIADLGIMTGTTIALAQVNCRFVQAVVADDEVRAVVTIVSKKPSRKPDRGTIVRRLHILNQRDELVVQGETVSVMRRRP